MAHISIDAVRQSGALHEVSRDIVIVEDEMSVRARLTAIIEGSGCYRIAASFPRCEEALVFLAQNPVWLVILDLGLPGISHGEAVASLRRLNRETEILVHTVFDGDAHVFAALQNGATGYIIKDDQPQKILDAIDELAQGGAPMSFAIARKVMAFFKMAKLPERNLPPVDQLTQREMEVLRLLYEGFTYRSIAERLSISLHTVHDHIKNIYRKLEVHSRGEAIHKAVKGSMLTS